MKQWAAEGSPVFEISLKVRCLVKLAAFNGICIYGLAAGTRFYSEAAFNLGTS